MKHTSTLVIFLMLSIASAYADVTETKTYDFELQQDGRISLSNINGDVRIEGISGTQVQIVATKKAESQKYLDDMEIKIEATKELIRIETHHQKNRSRWQNGGDSGSVAYHLKVPSNAQLDRIETVNGAVAIIGISGSVSVETVNGTMSLEGLAGEAKLNTVNGTIDAQFAVLGAGQSVNADAVNGRIVLRFPANASAQIHAETLNGGIDADDFGLKPDKGFVGRDLDGRIGAGEARVRVDTVNGSVSIQRSH